MGYDESNLNTVSDPNITARVNEEVGQTNQDRALQYGSGIGQARGLLTQPDNFSNQLGYGDKATSAAIKRRYSEPYMRDESRLKLENTRNADEDHLRALSVASAAAGQEVEDNRQKQILKFKIDQANKRARGAVLGTVLGITGGVAGGYAGSFGGQPAAGAMAGYAGGSGIGNAMGGDL